MEYKKEIRSGIFKAERIIIKGETPREAIKESFRNIGLEPLLKGYEERGRKVLEKEGYPVTPDELWQFENEDLPPRILDIKQMLLRCETVRDHVKRGDAENAAWNAILMVSAAMRAEIRPVEEHVYRGVKTLNERRRGAEVTNVKKKEEASPADEYIKTYKIRPGISKRSAAENIEKSMKKDPAYKGRKLKKETIRKLI